MTSVLQFAVTTPSLNFSQKVLVHLSVVSVNAEPLFPFRYKSEKFSVILVGAVSFLDLSLHITASHHTIYFFVAVLKCQRKSMV